MIAISIAMVLAVVAVLGYAWRTTPFEPAGAAARLRLRPAERHWTAPRR